MHPQFRVRVCVCVMVSAIPGAPRLGCSWRRDLTTGFSPSVARSVNIQRHRKALCWRQWAVLVGLHLRVWLLSRWASGSSQQAMTSPFTRNNAALAQSLPERRSCEVSKHSRVFKGSSIAQQAIPPLQQGFVLAAKGERVKGSGGG